MENFGIKLNCSTDSSRLELQCPHQNALIYSIPGEASWVCSEELRTAHALAGFLGDLINLQDPRISNLLNVWGLYYRIRPLEN